MAKPGELNTEGLYFVPVKGKMPSFGKGWQEEKLEYGEAIAHGGTGVGLSHGVSNTCCLDMDDIDAAVGWFKKHYDIDILEYLEGHFEVLSPNAKSGKFMFKLPEGIQLNKFVLKNEKLEFRSMGHQDVWPGSKYPPVNEDGEVDWRLWTAENGFYWHRGSEKLLDLPLPIVKIWQKHDQERESSPNGMSKEYEGSTDSREALYNNVVTGKDYHESLLKLSLGHIKDGMSAKESFIILSSLVIGSQPSPDRESSKQRVMADGFKELHDLIDGAHEHVEEDDSTVNVGDLENLARDDAINMREIPWPPGKMGELATAAYDYQRYQYRELAVVSSLGLIAGICGRKFDISHPATGLNVYLTVLGPTGIGKGSIEKFINQVLFNQSGIGKNISFIGDNDFTSGTVLVKKLENARCQVSITDEAGQSLSSKSGDPQKKVLTLLDLYSKSGSEDWAMNQGQRDKDNSTQKLKGTAFSWINISTPEVFKREFYQQGSVSNGLAPRMSIYSIDEIVLKSNKKPQLVLSSGLTDRLDYLISECSKVQAVEDFEAWQLELADELQDEAVELEEHYRGVMRDLRLSDVNKSDMHNRAYLKVLKFAGLATALNKTKDDPNPLVIEREEWEWAKAMVEYEMANIDSFFSGKYFGDGLAEGMAVVRKTIFRLFLDKHDVKDKFGNLSSQQKSQQKFTRTALYRRLRKNTVLKELDDDPKYKSKPKSGLDKCLDAMVDNGEIKEATDIHSRSKKVYKMLDGILAEANIEG